ncbi:MAG: RNA polymerase sigma factor SigF [Synechococcales cyanobacterium RM1_1_8]|nr:RNA polymerase sigma factor SigF [Synechococcales cyanobacterium RM1_1_8]
MDKTHSHQLKRDSLELLRDYREAPTAALRNRLVELNFGLVRREAIHWVKQCNESYDDLLQVGSLGLIRAVERFDVGRGRAFSSFAIPYIRGEIQHYLRDRGTTIRIPRRWQELRQKAASFVRKVHSLEHRLPTDPEIADYLEISVPEWQEVKLAHSNRSPLSLDAPLQDADEGSSSMAQLLADPRYKSFQLAQDDQIRLQQALSKIEHRTREILEFVFLHDLTQRETAERMGISTVTVSRRVKKGLDSLKTSLGSREAE